MSLSKEYISESEESDGEEVVYQPPRGYQKIESFKSLPNLQNKEVWLIKAPKGFKFDELKTLPISFNPIESSIEFQSGLKNYQVQEDLTTINIKDDKTTKYSLITPDSNKLKFNESVKINRFYNIRQSVKIPQIDYGKVVKKRKNVQVVKGLAPQHFATGYGKTELDVTSDVEEEDKSSKNALNKDSDGDIVIKDQSSSPKKEKKHKKDKKDKKDKKKEKK